MITVRPRSSTRRLLATGLGAALLLTVPLLGGPGTAEAVQTDQAARPVVATPRTQRLDAWWFDAMHLPAVQKETTGKGVTIALIDAALDPSVPDLAGADIEMRTDCRGADVKPLRSPVADHGSAMATLIVGQGSGTGPGGSGVLGVAPDAELRFYSADYRPSTDALDCSELSDGELMVRAAKEGADIISISLGVGGGIAPYVKQVLAMGVPVVASTGDLRKGTVVGQVEYPAAVPGTVGVNAVDRHAQPWKYNPRAYLSSRFQAFAAISGPGVDVTNVGLAPGGTWLTGVSRTGTSDATAIVAGSLALLKSKYPDATGNQLIQSLIHDTGGTRPYKWDESFGFGIVSAKEMLAHDPTEWPDVNPLLGGPRKAVQDYPMSIRGAAATPSGSPSGGGSASASTAPSGSTGSAASEASATGGGGLPGWVLAVGAVVLVAGVAGAVTKNKRGSRPVATDDNAKDV